MSGWAKQHGERLGRTGDAVRTRVVNGTGVTGAVFLFKGMRISAGGEES